MVKVLDVTFQLLFIDVDDCQVIARALIHQSIRVSDAHIACANKHNFITNDIFHILKAPFLTTYLYRQVCPIFCDYARFAVVL